MRYLPGNAGMKIDYCDCGMPWLQDDDSCSRCDKRIEPARLEIIKENPIYKETGENSGEPETYDYPNDVEYKHSLNKTIRDGSVPLFTTFDVPGRQIVESLGMISGVGNAMFTLTRTSSRLTNRATTKALNNLIAEAARIEADAVVGVNLALNSFGQGLVQQLAVFTGTAVRFKK